MGNKEGRRPSFSDLAAAERLHFGNGVGPSWIPCAVRLCITTYVSWFFADASWRHHDFGYSIGRTERERWSYDWRFFRAMVTDALSQSPAIWIVAAPLGLVVALIFYLCVMAGGWTSFRYDHRYRTIDEALGSIIRQTDAAGSPRGIAGEPPEE